MMDSKFGAPHHPFFSFSRFSSSTTKSWWAPLAKPEAGGHRRLQLCSAWALIL